MAIAVVLLNLGGPDSLQAIRPFLYNLFSDRKIIRLGPPFLQKPLARLIATLRSAKTKEIYRQIGGKSPILEITAAQAQALETALNEAPREWLDTITRGGCARQPSRSPLFKVYVGMRYWHPFIEDVVDRIAKQGIRKIIGLSLYPQYSVTTSGSSIANLEESARRYGIETTMIPSWHTHPLYIAALVDVIEKAFRSFRDGLAADNRSAASSDALVSGDVHILFSAHSLPKKVVEEGDPYVEHTIGTIKEVEKNIPITWHLSYQSKSGPVAWLEPSTEEKLEDLARDGIRKVLIVPISFVSDHVETLYEIDILYMNFAGKLGINMKRTESLNTHPLFIAALRDLVLKALRDARWG